MTLREPDRPPHDAGVSTLEEETAKHGCDWVAVRRQRAIELGRPINIGDLRRGYRQLRRSWFVLIISVTIVVACTMVTGADLVARVGGCR